MTEKDIVRLAEEAELWLHTDRKYEAVKKFANLVEAAVRESTASPQRENEFTPDWDSMAVMVEEQQRMAKRIQVLEAALAQPEPVIYARKEGDLIVADLPQVSTGGGGIFKDEQPEPLGWVKIEEVRQHFDTAGCGTIYKTGGEGRVPLYTAPPKPEPMIDGWPLYSGLPPQEEQGLTATPLPAIKLQDERESQYKSFAQYAQVIGIPKKEWVGLKDETYWEMWVESPSDVLRFAHAIEAKLKENNYD